MIAPLSFFWELKLKRFPKLTNYLHIQVGVRKNSNNYFVDSGCSKHVIGKTEDFFLLKALQGRGVFLRKRKKGNILGIKKIGKSLNQTIKNVYYQQGARICAL